MPQLTVYLLGAPRVERDGVPLDLTTRKALALLAYLAITGTTHSRDSLATLFWPESGQAHARGALRYTLAMLKHALGDEWLHATREQIGLPRRAELDVDVVRFDWLIAQWQAHGHTAEQVCPACVTSLREAVGLQRGPLLAGFTLPDSPGFDDWQFFETERLQRAQAAALAALVASYRAAGAFAEAIPYAQRWLALDPLQEAVHRELMQLYADAGQRAAALRQYTTCVQVLEAELGVTPAPETTALYHQFHTSVPEATALPPVPAVSFGARPSARPPLPVATTPLVGREHELAALQTLLDDPACRLLTLLGPGGSGKTRLALALAEARQAVHTHGVAFVPLAALSSPEALVATVTTAVGCPPPGRADPRQHLLDYLHAKHLLLVLDNLEPLLDRAAEEPGHALALIQSILATAPGVQLLVTSRERLQLYEEQLYLVRGLDYPDWEVPQNAAEYAAVQLFHQRARRVQPDFVLSPAALPAVTGIVRLAAGQPLAIELAAAWVGALAPDEIASEIAQRLDLLATEARNVPERHRSMRAVYELSWQRLQPDERVLLQALAIFRGGFTRGAAAEVAGASPRALQALLDQSVLGRDALSNGAGRYDLHELLRQYAIEHLARDAAALAGVAARHGAYFLRFLAVRAADLKGSRQPAALQEIEVELQNVRTAWEWAVAERQGALFGPALDGLCGFYERRGRYREGVAACELVTNRGREAAPFAADAVVLAHALAWQAAFCSSLGQLAQGAELIEQSLVLLDAPAAAPVRAFALLQRARVAFLGDDIADAQRWYERSLAEYQVQGDRWGMAMALHGLGLLAWTAHDYVAADHQCARSLAIFRELGDRSGIASALDGLARVAIFRVQLADAHRLLDECSAICRELQDRAGAAQARFNLGGTLLFAGQFAAARPALEESLAIFQDLGNRPSIASVSPILASTYIGLGLYDQATALAHVLLAGARESGSRLGIASALLFLGWAAVGRGEYGEADRHLHESLNLHQAAPPSAGLVLTLALLSHTSRALGQHKAAWEQGAAAVRTATAVRELRASVVALGALAVLLAEQGDVERAVELEALVARYPMAANSHFFGEVTHRQIVAATTGLSPEVVAAAQVRGRSRDLDTTLGELAEMIVSGSLA